MKYQQENECKFLTKIHDIIYQRNTIFLISEFCSYGDLYSYQCNYYQYFDEKLTSQILYQIIYGIEQLHNIGIIHRDLKPENILITQFDDAFFIKLSDFGISSLSEMTQSQVGTINYMAVEILKNEVYDGAVDIWSFGCIAYELIHNQQLFSDLSQIKIARKIFNYREEQFNQIDNKYPQLMEIIYNCLRVDSKKRPSAQEIRLRLEKIIQDYKNPNQLTYQNNQQHDNCIDDYNTILQDQHVSNETSDEDIESKSLLNKKNQNENLQNKIEKNNMTTTYQIPQQFLQQPIQQYQETSEIKLKHDKNDLYPVQSIKISDKEDSKINLQAKRDKHEQLFKHGLPYVQEQEFFSRSIFYPIYKKDIQNFKIGVQNIKNALVYLIIILIDLIKNEDFQNINRVLESLQLTENEQELKQINILKYVIFNCLLRSDVANFDLEEYMAKEVLRVDIVKKALVNISKNKTKQIFEYKISQNQLTSSQRILSSIIPTKMKQFCSFFCRKRIICPMMLLIIAAIVTVVIFAFREKLPHAFVSMNQKEYQQPNFLSE